MINRILTRPFVLAVCATLFVTQLAAAESPGERLSLDENWEFHLGDIPLDSFPGGQGIALYGPDITHSGAKAGHVWGAAARGFNVTKSEVG